MIEHIFDWISIILIFIGVIFFIAGTAGLVRFPDVYTRLHALTKADNIGLGFVALGLVFQAGEAHLILKLFLVWFFIVISGATACYLIARAALDMNIEPWKKS